jgi:2-haloacid dehalogenase
MKMDRREFLCLTAAGTLAGGRTVAATLTTEPPGFAAVAFDALAIFDARPVAALAESLFPGKGSEIMTAWRARQFEYQWLRALAGQYADFLQVTEQSLLFASKELKLDLSVDQRRQLMWQWSNLGVWPEVPEALAALRRAGVRLAVLSNMTSAMLVDGLKRAQIDRMFEAVLSTDQNRSYKPDPRSYQLATDRLRLRREQILFAASAGWDVAGGKWFGYPTFWVNRLGATAEELGVAADATGPHLGSLVKFALPGNR